MPHDSSFRKLRSHSGRVSFLPGVCLLLWISNLSDSVFAAEKQGEFRAGTCIVDITPTQFPVLVNAMFTERSSTNVTDRLHVRALALDDGSTQVVVAVVDSCMVGRDLLDRAKARASQETGVPTERMLVSCTHTHSAPSAFGCLGSRMDTNYARMLEPRISEAITGAIKALTPARVGWGSFDAWEHTYNRRWIRRPDRILVDPFGDRSVRAHMHPGHESPDAVGPSGPVDPGFSVLAFQTREGAPLAILANFSQHYYGSPLLSSDYFGRFCSYLVEFLDPGKVARGFLPIISQGTSGDLMWMDYSAPARDIGYDAYARELAVKAAEVVRGIQFKDWVPLRMAERTLELNYRVPDASRLVWARQLAKTFQGRLPATLPEVYALEAIHLHDRPRTELKLQALRIGDVGITALPNEVYAITGLKLKAQSPFPFTFNIELANGAEGYIPPPEQHHLGGYTTWAARTAGLEIQAEPRIVETLLSLLEEVSARPRVAVADTHGAYAQTVLNSKPAAYWRLNEINIPIALDATPNQRHARFEDGIAVYLPGASGRIGFRPPQLDKTNSFSGTQINRAVHFAGGRLRAGSTGGTGPYTVEFWFWNGLPSSARPVTGHLFSRGKDGVFGAPGEHLSIGGTRAAPGRLVFSNGGSDVSQSLVGRSEIALRTWNHLVLVRDGRRATIYLNGDPIPELAGDLEPGRVTGEDELFFGGRSDGTAGLEGKLDEIACYNRALAPGEVTAHFEAARVPRPVTAAVGPKGPAGFGTQDLQALKPVGFWLVPAAEGRTVPSVSQQMTAHAEDGVELPSAESVSAQFKGGRLRAKATGLSMTYSISFWFMNELPHSARSVTAYLFSRGEEGNELVGDHVGIGGTHSDAGRLIWFNGNRRNELVAGKTILTPKAWHHVVMVREGRKVRVYLDGGDKPDLEGELEPTFEASSAMLFLGGRSDGFSNLTGRMSEIALFDRALRSEEIHTISRSRSTNSAALRNPAHPTPAVSSSPISPEASLSKIHAPKGFKVELAAAEPVVTSPVAIDWDAQGRLWVVEMLDYPLGVDGAGKAGGRVRVLEDSDQDGRYDRSLLFAEGLSFPTGILTWRDGVIITAAPEIVFLKDGDGDGKADVRKVLFSGFFEGNQQLRVNGLRWGIDNWVYCASGAHHGGYATTTRIKSHINGREYSIGSRDFRFQPDTGELEAQSGPSQFGRNPDDWGHWFGVQNSWPVWHYVLQDHYLKRNPHSASPDPRQQIITPGNPKVFPASLREKRFHNFGESGHFTSACATMIYRDDLLFAQGSARHAFTCEPFHNLIQHFVLTDEGVTFRGARAEEGSHDFFASEDRWCRPVMARTGPDGALWVVDMYRYMIEHPEWLPPEGKAELLPHYRLGEDRGRIYRVVPDKAPRRSSVALATVDHSSLVKSLGSSNGWERDKAQMMLLWRKDAGSIPMLETQLRESPNELCRLHTLATLEGLGALSTSSLASALRDPHPGLRLHALRLAEKRSEPIVISAAAALVHDPDPKVRLQLGCSLGQWSTSEAGAALGRLAVATHTNAFMKAAVLSSALPHTLALTEAVAAAGGPALDAYSEALLQISLAASDLKPMARLLEPIIKPSQNGYSVAQIEAFGQFLDVLSKNNQTLQTLQERSSNSGELLKTLAHAKGLFSTAVSLITRSETPVLERIAAARVLLRDPKHHSEAIASLGALLIPQTAVESQRAALQAMTLSSDPGVPGLITRSWVSLGPDIRGVALDVLLSREPWSHELLRFVEKGVIASDALDAARSGRLLRHGSGRVQSLASKVLGPSARITRPKVVETYKPALDLAGHWERGTAAFTRLCASCHRLGDVGNDIGPNLRSVAAHSREKLLVSILDPNASIEPGYTAYLAELGNGDQVYGLISAETGNSLVFKLADGTTRTLLRKEIGSLKSANLSLMPEGLEAGMNTQDLADLIALLQRKEQ